MSYRLTLLLQVPLHALLISLFTFLNQFKNQYLHLYFLYQFLFPTLQAQYYYLLESVMDPIQSFCFEVIPHTFHRELVSDLHMILLLYPFNKIWIEYAFNKNTY